MKLETKRETIYHGLGRGSSKRYFVYLDGDRLGDGETREAAEQAALQHISDAHKYLTASAVARVGCDGTVIVFRQISDDCAMYEFCRNGNAGSSCCMGKMSDGWNQFRSLAEYADYVLAHYNEAHVPAVA